MTRIYINYIGGDNTTKKNIIIKSIQKIINQRLNAMKEKYRNILINDIEIVINKYDNKNIILNNIKNIIDTRLADIKNKYRTILFNDINNKINQLYINTNNDIKNDIENELPFYRPTRILP
jgi:hypothetical protein